MLMKKFTNFTKKIFIFFLIFNLTFVSTAQAAGVFVDSFDIGDEESLGSNLKIAKILGPFNLELQLENNLFSKKNSNLNLSLSSQF